MKYFFLSAAALLVAAFLCFAACTSRVPQQPAAGPVSTPGSTPVTRPYDTWVYRSVLDRKTRIISMALHKKLWVAYNTQTGGLYKAWKGSIDFDGPVYTKAHGPQPISVGVAYQEEPGGNPWRIRGNGQEATPQVNYRGHAFRNQQVVLQYELVYQGRRIAVEEMPEFFAVDGDTARAGLARTFTLSGVPAGLQVTLQLHPASLRAETDVKTNSTFTSQDKITETLQGQAYLSLPGRLLLNSAGKTTFAVAYQAKPALPSPEAVLGEEEAVLALMDKSDCNTCHNKEVKTVGPAYTAIAQRYANNTESLNKLVSKVIKGGAGSWGEVPMTAHPELHRRDATRMVAYVLGLDAAAEKQQDQKLMARPSFDISFKPLDPATASRRESPGIAVNFYQFQDRLAALPQLKAGMQPMASGVINALHADQDGFGPFRENFMLQASGFINLAKTTNVVFRLVSNKGARLYIDNKLVIDDNPSDGHKPKDGEVYLKAGKHPFRVEYFQNSGDKRLSLQWQPHGARAFTVVPPSVFTYTGQQIRKTQPQPIAGARPVVVPGDAAPLEAVHPSFELAQARPAAFKPKVGGMDFLPDGRLVVSTWDSLGAVYVLEGVQGNKPEAIKVKRIASGLAEPLGLKVVDNQIYVLQKQELTRLVDTNHDDIIDEYQTLCNGWQVSSNFHEFAFGLVYKDGYFYGTLATAINPGGASTKPQIPDRGKVLRISSKDGSFSFIATGLRTPNGIGLGVDNEIFIADNQGDWLPASKVVHLQEGAWYGSRSVDFAGTANLKETLPMVWLQQNEIGNSPSQPVKLDVGPYKNQMIHGDITHGGIKRVFPEKVNGQYQGAVFRFTQGLECGVNRLTWGPDGALYVGGVGSNGNWGHAGKLLYGLQRLKYNQKTTFEMLAVRARSNGMEIEFTEPLQQGLGAKAADYLVKQWRYKPTAAYGGPKLDEQQLAIRSITCSPDRRKVFLELGGMKENHLVYIRLSKQAFTSQSGQQLWTTETWYTLNQIPRQAGGVFTQR